MAFRSAHWILNFVSAFVILAVVLLVFAGWRLSQQPVSIDFLEPVLEDNLSSSTGDIRVDVGETYLAWSGTTRRLGLQARDWRVYDDQDRLLASFPRADVIFSLTELLKGNLAPIEIDILDARVNLVRDQEGRFRMGGLGQDTESEEGFNELAKRFLGRMLSKTPGDEPWSYLQKLHITRADLVLEDRRLGTVFSAENSDIDIWREPSGIGGQADLGLRLGDQLTPVAASFHYGKSNDAIDINLSLNGFDPTATGSAFDAFLPQSQSLSGLEFILDAQFRGQIPLSGEMPNGSFSMRSDGGHLNLPRHFNRSLAFETLSVEGELHSNDKHLLTVSDASLDLLSPETGQSGPAISLTAELEAMQQGYGVGLEGEIRNVRARELSHFWPLAVAENARDWVTDNIRDGGVNMLELRAALDFDEALNVNLREMAGGFDYEGLEIHYLEPLPPAVSTSGTASFTPDGLDFVIAEGQVNGIEVTEGLLDIHGLSGEDHRLDLSLQANGALTAAFQILEHPRLALLQEMGFTAAGSEGQFDTDLNFAFPLLDDLEFDDVNLSAAGQLEDVFIANAFLEEDMRGSPLDIQVNQDEMQVQGPMQLGAVRGTANWREVFAGPGLRTELAAEIPALDEAGWAVIDVDPAPYLSGPAAVSLSARVYADERAEIDVQADLFDTEVQIPELQWRKPASREGNLNAQLVLQGERFLGAENFEFSTEDLQASGVITMNEPGQEIQEAALSSFNMGRSSLQDIVMRRPSGSALEVELGGGVLDLVPLMEDTDDTDSDMELSSSADEDPQDLVIRAPSLSRVYFSQDRYFENLSVAAERRDGLWLMARGRADLPGSSPVPDTESGAEAPIPDGLRLNYGPVESGGHRLELTASDMGALLEAADLTEGIRGGAMRISGEADGPYPQAPLNLRIWSQDFRLVNAPAMAQLLTVASLSGIANLMSGEGIVFERLHGDAIVYETQITSELIQANGPSLGITAKGRLDMEGKATDIRGTLVPAYSINSVLGSIPLIGDLLTGGEGEGILGFSYAVSGPIEDPDIAVNPLSVLAPGFLRQLFNIAPDTSPPDESPTEDGGGAEDDEEPAFETRPPSRGR
ncbi:YhdP family protein [Fodinicurvata sediminis]|uniref:YhdP family protein n=1 Tax=Fodinicurvata sediminis TaxID=1121832 RepID=UPI0003B36273|nr:AsmA-like C-terminal region-containing protein [Fodinicurvata sediminis]